MLTQQQVRFIHQYLKDGNARQAALRAGYSPNSARKYAHALLRKPEVQQYIDQARQKVAAEMELSLEAIVAEYAKIAFLDIRKLFDEEGRPIPMQYLPPDTASAITSLEVTSSHGTAKTQRIRIKDKVAALDRICKLLGLTPPPAGDANTSPIPWVDNTGHD